MLFIVTLVLLVICLIIVAEVLHWHAGKNLSFRAIHSDDSCAILVLGFPSKRNGKPHAIQKWRVNIGARTLKILPQGVIVFAGGTRRSGEVEGKAMAGYARTLGVPEDQIIIEGTSRTTWENIKLSLPLAEKYEWIAIASDPLHARKAYRYAIVQRPDLRKKIMMADNYHFLEYFWLKVPTAIYDIYSRFKSTRTQTQH